MNKNICDENILFTVDIDFATMKWMTLDLVWKYMLIVDRSNVTWFTFSQKKGFEMAVSEKQI